MFLSFSQKLGNVTISHHAKKKKLPGKVIYTSPIGEPFDLAVIKVTYEESGDNFSSQLFTNVVAPLNIGEIFLCGGTSRR